MGSFAAAIRRNLFFAPLLGLFFTLSLALADPGKILDSDDEAALARLLIADNAQKELSVSYFIFKEDSFGNSTLAMMREAAKRGVKVRLLLDYHQMEVSHAMIAHLMEAGVEVKAYHPYGITRNPTWIWRRMHDKIFTSDGQRAAVGGRNIQNNFFTDRKAGKNRYMDLDVYVEGPSAKGPQDYFDEIWSSKHVEKLDVSKVARAEIKQKGRTLDRYEKFLKTFRASHSGQIQNLLDGRYELSNLQFFHDNVNAKGTAPGTEEGLLKVIRGAKKELVLENAYVILTDDIKKALKDAVDRGVEVHVMTNNAESNDIRMAGMRYKAERQELSDMGVHVWEYKREGGGPGMVHGKTAFADGKSMFVGTFNLDPRSRFLNMEVGYTFDSTQGAKDLMARFDRFRESAHEYLSPARMAARGIASPPAAREPTSVRCKAAFYQALTFVLRPQL